MEELVRPHGLGDAVREVEPRHLLVSGLRVDADQLGALQALDEGQGVADGGQQDVAARLVRLGLDGEAEVVALLDDVLAQQIEGLLHPVEGQADVLRPAGLGPLAAAPRHEGARAQLDGEVDVAQRLAERVTAYATVVGGEPAVLEDGMGEEVRGHHGHDESAAVDRLPEALDDPFALGLRRPEGDQVVVVEGHPPGAQFREPPHRLDGVDGRAGRVAEGVPALPAHGPQAEAELVLGGGGEAFRHRRPTAFACRRDARPPARHPYLFSVMTNQAHRTSTREPPDGRSRPRPLCRAATIP